MAQQSSERACDRCRERRVKCDKRQPTCLRCEKLGKPCPGYDKKRKFVDEGVSLRRKYQAPSDYRKGGEQVSEETAEQDTSAGASESSTVAFRLGPRTSNGEHRGSVGNDSLHSQGPVNSTRLGSATGIIEADPLGENHMHNSHVTSVSGAPYIDALKDPAPFSEASSAPHGLQGDVSPETWKNPTFDPEWFNLDPATYYAQNNNSCGFIPNAHIVDEVDRSDFRQITEPSSATPMSISGIASFSDSNLWASESQLHTSAIISDEREHEMAFLIRHFTEAIGPWMDLFDTDRHFEQLVPLKALRDALLRNAVAAVAAKQLGRTGGKKPFVGNQCQKPATMEVIEDSGIDWFYKAANYYDKAIAYSRVYLQAVSGSLNTPPSPNTQASLSLANSDDLLVAVSIFSLYEALDNVELGWFQHLTGLNSLLTAVSAHQQEQHQIIPAITVGRQASFWNFARADYQAAFVHRRKTLLDTNDLQLWNDCGLQIQNDGTLYADPEKIKNDSLHCRKICQLCAHTLLWLVLRVTNYVAVDSDQNPSTRQATWNQLTASLDAWYTSLPDTFQPCAEIRHPLKSRTQPRSNNNNGTTKLTEVFFSITVCAAALQLYHFARMVLLLNKPSHSSTSVSRLKAYREVSSEAIKHARHIVGIGLARPPAAVRVEMSLPLYVAGGCFEDDEERRVVLDMLKAIEQDTGCANDIKVNSLIDEWGWNQEPEGLP